MSDIECFKRSSYKPHFGSKVKVTFSPYVEKSASIKFGESVADPSFYRPTSELVREFVAAGRNLVASSASQYDFPVDKEKQTNGVDDGRKVSILDSPYTPDPADVSTEFRDQANRLEKKKLTAQEKEMEERTEKERHEALLKALTKDARPDSENLPPDTPQK